MAEEVKISVLIDAAQSQTTLGGLKDSVEALTNELEKTEIGTDEYKKLNQALVQTNKEVKNLELGFESLDREQVASEMGSVAGAIGDVTTAFILLGDENEEIEKIAKNIETAMGVSMAFKGAIEGISSAQKLWNNVISKYTVIQKAATVAQKIFNIVLNLNPIGLIVTAVGLLITGLVALGKNVKSVGEFFIWFKDMTVEALSVILSFFGLIDKAIETNSMKEREQRRQREAFNKKEKEEHRQRLEQINKERALRIRSANKTIEALELEKDTLEANGKSSYKVTLQILEAEKEKQQAVLDANQKKLESYIEYYKNIAAFNGQSEEEFIESMKKQGIDLEVAQKKAEALIQKNRDNVQRAENEITRFKRQENERRASDAKRIEDEKNQAIKEANDAQEKEEEERRKREKEALAKAAKEEEDLQKRKIEALKALDEIEIQNINDKFEREKALKLAQFEKEIEFLDETIEEENALIIAKRLQLEEALGLIEEEKENEKKQKTLDQATNSINLASQTLQTIDALGSAFHGKELKRIKEKKSRGEKLTKDEEKRLRKEEKIRRAAAIAQITADTAAGIISAVKAGAGVPFPGNLLAIGSGIAAVLSGSAQAFASIGGGSPPSAPTISNDTINEDIQETNVQPETQDIESGSTLLNQPNQVYVLESDITETQNNVAVIEQQATFG